MNWKCFVNQLINAPLNKQPRDIDYSLPSVDLVKLLDSGVSEAQGQRIVTLLLKRLIEKPMKRAENDGTHK
jgi:hypothetical protein